MKPLFIFKNIKSFKSKVLKNGIKHQIEQGTGSEVQLAHQFSLFFYILFFAMIRLALRVWFMVESVGSVGPTQFFLPMFKSKYSLSVDSNSNYCIILLLNDNVCQIKNNKL